MFLFTSCIPGIVVVAVNTKGTARAKLGNTPATSKDDLFAAVKQERRVELPFEGVRLGDLKRYEQDTNSIDGDGNAVETFHWNSPKLIFPIPKRERDANPNLTQNEGYQ